MEQTDVGNIPSNVQEIPDRMQAARERINEQARYVAGRPATCRAVRSSPGDPS